MGTVATIAAVVGAGAAVYGAVQSAKAGRKAARAQQQQAVLQQQQVGIQREQAEEQRKAQVIQERRSRRSAIRRNQVARAQALSSAQSAGGFGGSAVAGGIGSMSSRLGESLGFGSQMSGISQNITNLGAQSAGIQGQIAGLGGQIAGYQGDQAVASSIGSIGGSLFNFGMDMGAFQGGQTPNRPPQVNSGFSDTANGGIGSLY